jgi:hypothetical protein
MTTTLAASQNTGKPFEIVVDSSAAPQYANYAERAQALTQEWYPKIDEILFGPGHPFFHRKITIIIDAAPSEPVIYQGRPGTVNASSPQGVIRFHTDWLAHAPTDFDATVVHEVTHVNQDNYAMHIARCDGIRGLPCFFRIHFSRPNRGMDWLAESICDYIAHGVYDGTLEPRLTTPARRRGYRDAYMSGASFLLWLERTKDRDIVRKLNIAMSGLHCSPDLLRQWTGASLDRLWAEFTRQ